MQVIDQSYWDRNVKLYLENTEELYKNALEVTDFNVDNNQISNLTLATLNRITKDGQLENPSYEKVEKLKIITVQTVKQLQEDAKS